VRQAEAERRHRAVEQIDRLLTTRPADVPALAEGFADADPPLRAALADRLQAAAPAERWRLRAALLPHDVLAPYADAVAEDLWKRVRARTVKQAVLVRLAVVLAGLSPEDERWTQIAPGVARAVTVQAGLHLRTYVDALRPVREFLLEPLYDVYADDQELRAQNRETTAAILRDLGADRPELLARIVADSPLRGGEESFAALKRAVVPEALDVLRGIAGGAAPPEASVPERMRVGRRRSAAVAALLRLREPPDVAELFEPCADPELVAQLARAAPARDVPAESLVELLTETRSAAARYALLMALGEYPIEGFEPELRERLAQFAARLEAEDDDPGVHSAAAWFALQLREWKQEETLGGGARGGAPRLDAARAAYDPTGRRGWFTVQLRRWRLTFSVFRPGGVLLGSPDDESGRAENEGPPQRTRITRSFALCRAEVTRGEFEAFMEATKTYGLPDIGEWSAGAAEPVVAPTWIEAMQYATWATAVAIGKKLGIVYTFGLQEPARSRAFLRLPLRIGSFRLPTEAEWEYACRSGTETAFSFGSDRSLLNRYGYFADNAGQRTYEAGLLRPGPTGLFNMHGQCWEWCMDWYGPYTAGPVTDPVGPQDGGRKVVRGGSWNLGARYARSASRDAHIPSNRNYNVSFRLAVTLPEPDPDWTPSRPNPLPWTG
jgi:formylglycine-generating enzyme required for sulfatase activity